VPGAARPEVRRADCSLAPLTTIAGELVYALEDQSALVYISGMTVDADGAPNAYHPPPDTDLGLDDLANAGSEGNWWGLATDADGEPIVQGPDDPAPGFYVSTTSLFDPDLPITQRYVDATRIPFYVLPPAGRTQLGVHLGDLGMVVNTDNRQRAGAIFADVGPTDNLGEGSIALAAALGLPDDPRAGGASGGIAWVVFPGSGTGRPLPPETIAAGAEARFTDFGGMAQLDACFP
jgi:hypothetical protein